MIDPPLVLDEINSCKPQRRDKKRGDEAVPAGAEQSRLQGG